MVRSKVLIGFLLSLGLFMTAQAQVTLSNGVTVPKEKFIVFIFGGCCDMSGRTGDGDMTPDPRCWGLPPGKSDWLPLKDVMFNNSQGAGPAVPFMDEMVARYPGYYFGVIQWSTSYGALRENCSSKGFYMKSCAGYTKVMTEAKKWQSKVTIGGLFTMLGVAEAEASSISFAETYSADYKMMVDTMRKELGLTSQTFPVCLMEQYASTGNLSLSLPKPAKVLEQHKKVPTILAGAATVSTKGVVIAQSNHHPGHPGFHVMGKNWADTIKAHNFDFWARTTSTVKRENNSTISGITVSQIGKFVDITVPVGSRVNITVTRLNGSLVKRSVVDGRVGTHRIKGLIPGMYLLEMTGKGLNESKRLLVR